MRDLNKIEVLGTVSDTVRTAQSKKGLPIANVLQFKKDKQV